MNDCCLTTHTQTHINIYIYTHVHIYDNIKSAVDDFLTNEIQALQY